MKRILLIPTSDYTGHPFMQRQNHIFERISSYGLLEVHVIGFRLFENQRLKTTTFIHDIGDLKVKPVGLYYLLNLPIHGGLIGEVVKREGIDLLVMSNLSPCLSYKAIGTRSVPAVFDLPDYFPASASGYLADYGTKGGLLLESAFQGMLKFIVKDVNAMTVASNALSEYADKLGVKEPIYLPNGVDQQFFGSFDGKMVRERYGIGEDELVVGYVGSLAFWLNMPRLLEGITMAIQKGVPLKLLIVGGNLHGDYVSMLKKWIAQAGISDHVLFTGFVPYTEVPAYIAAMDIGTLPHDEGNPVGYYAGPNKFWEYLSQGKPVFASPIPESYVYEDFIEIIPSAEEFCNRLLAYSKNPEPFLAKSGKGRVKARTMTWDKAARSMQDLILSTLG
jgi:glycosyltransferase involved in cell wall biosynthesis